MKTEFKPFDRTQDDYATRAIFKMMAQPTLEELADRAKDLEVKSNVLIYEAEKSINAALNCISGPCEHHHQENRRTKSAKS